MKKILIIFTVLCLIFSFTGCSKTIKDDNKEIKPDAITDKNSTYTYSDYKNVDFYYLSGLKIPNEWEYRENENGFMLIEKITGSEIDFSIEKYVPDINNVSYSNRQSYYGDNFISFTKPLGNKIVTKFLFNYQSKKFTETDTSIFNFGYIYTIKYIAEPTYFDKYLEVYNTVVDSLALNNEMLTITNGYDGLYFNSIGILFQYPKDWTTTLSETGFTTKIANSSIVVTINNPIMNFTGLNATTYNSIMKQTSSTFSTTSFNSDGQICNAEGYYTADSTKYIVCNKIYNTNNYSINILYVAPEKEADIYYNQFDIISNALYIQ